MKTPSFGDTVDGVSSLQVSLQYLGEKFTIQLLALMHKNCDRFPTKPGSHDFEKFQQLRSDYQAILIDALVLEKAAYNEASAAATLECYYAPLFDDDTAEVQYALEQIEARRSHLLEVIAKKGK